MLLTLREQCAQVTQGLAYMHSQGVVSITSFSAHQSSHKFMTSYRYMGISRRLASDDSAA